MVVEHVFVTTLPPNEAMGRAADLLARHGFISANNHAFSLDPSQAATWTTLEVRRGATVVNKASGVMTLPQQVRLEWDRGRVTVACSAADRFSRKRREELLTSIASALELLLAQQAPSTDASAALAALEHRLRAAGRRRTLIRVSIAVVFVLVMIGTVWFSARHR